MSSAAASLSTLERDTVWDRLERERFDVVPIGARTGPDTSVEQQEGAA
jgi:hypothetical protein